jgi:hypothetical protein
MFECLMKYYIVPSKFAKPPAQNDPEMECL